MLSNYITDEIKETKINEDNTEELMHYGIKGMKWGHRRFQNSDGSLTKAGQKRYADESKPKEPNAHAELKKKKIKDMSDAELKRYKERMQMEKDAAAAEKEIAKNTGPMSALRAKLANIAGVASSLKSIVGDVKSTISDTSTLIGMGKKALSKFKKNDNDDDDNNDPKPPNSKEKQKVDDNNTPPPPPPPSGSAKGVKGMKWKKDIPTVDPDEIIDNRKKTSDDNNKKDKDYWDIEAEPLNKKYNTKSLNRTLFSKPMSEIPENTSPVNSYLPLLKNTSFLPTINNKKKKVYINF